MNMKVPLDSRDSIMPKTNSECKRKIKVSCEENLFGEIWKVYKIYSSIYVICMIFTNFYKP